MSMKERCPLMLSTHIPNYVCFPSFLGVFGTGGMGWHGILTPSNLKIESGQ